MAGAGANVHHVTSHGERERETFWAPAACGPCCRAAYMQKRRCAQTQRASRAAEVSCGAGFPGCGGQAEATLDSNSLL